MAGGGAGSDGGDGVVGGGSGSGGGDDVGGGGSGNDDGDCEVVCVRFSCGALLSGGDLVVCGDLV